MSFDTLLVANRGEIACRVMGTARRMGLRCVAVYSEPDAGALHVRMADDACCIGPARASESYLSAQRILEAARRCGAGAIHPGYGFLSENADFAEACRGAGLVFVGPSADAIRAMGSKDAAKLIMEKAGVPVVPGYHGEEQGAAALEEAAANIGYPLLVKAVAGGGGRGMREVASAAALPKALEAARREARGAFGNDHLLLEKLVSPARHVEVQIFADAQGSVLHLFERDCSIQRRHQKVIEEAPAPGLSAKTRSAMGEAAVCAARAIAYEGAGTVEFLLDCSDGDERFYFMEMNTRLQVEHPVTEMIHGVDLVEWQLRVAAGEPLPLGQESLAPHGHAMEARIYAEDPARRFLPSPGTIVHLAEPPASDALRIETGVVAGDTITVHYDPMLAKLVAWGADREAARRQLAAALAAYEIAGPATNRSFLSRVVTHPAFAAGAVHTGFIEEHRAQLLPPPAPLPDRALALACVDAILCRTPSASRGSATRQAGDPFSPWDAADGWLLNAEGWDELVFADGDEELRVRVHYSSEPGTLGPGAAPGEYRMELPGGEQRVRGRVLERIARHGVEIHRLEAWLADTRVAATLVHRADLIDLFCAGEHHVLVPHDPRHSVCDEAEAAGAIVTPMPGKITRVFVEAGQRVKKGEPLLVLEAMKMEHTIAAPAAAVVESLGCAVGDQVEEGATLVVLGSG
ncbi:MAG: biotin/lipoyl-binding protein [Deltaproteobacteria bacterium]|nr:biotin/lipoyl-binding protein [Deltaproteobacteria bacterium]